MNNPQWEIKIHNYQIGDTGDHDGYYELTNGKISLITKDDLDFEEREHPLVTILNETDINWEDWIYSNIEFELSLEKQRAEDWKKVSERLIEGLKYYIRCRWDCSEANRVIAVYEDLINHLV